MASDLKTTIREELTALQAASRDRILYPKQALEWARVNRNSALHRALEWDNRKAAESWRLQQVRQFITLHITHADGSPQVISLSIDRTSGGGYRQLSDVMKVPDLRKIAVADALRELERVRLKYEHLVELVHVWEAMDGIQTSPPHPKPSPKPPPKRPRDGPKRGGSTRKKAPPRGGSRGLDIPPIQL